MEDYFCFKLDKADKGCFSTFLQVSGLDLIFIILWILFGFYWTDNWLNHSDECSIQGLQLCCTGGGVKRLLGSAPPNAKGKSSFHWLILNVISLCIIVDLREDIFLQTVWRDLDAHKPSFRWNSGVRTLRGLHSAGSLLSEHAVESKEWTLCTEDKIPLHTVLFKNVKQIKLYCALQSVWQYVFLAVSHYHWILRIY